jgi:MoxR-like ATPase
LVSINFNLVADIYQKINSEISKVVIGKEAVKESLMLALVAGGNLLIEGLPGSAKTILSKSFAQVIGGTFQRIQFTPDMMPADVTGFNLYSADGKNNFVDGPIFANIVLADELNRTTPRTQSALLESMQEHQVTVEKRTYPLPRPFLVIATQVQAGGEGTYALTDVQVDRFLLHILSQYPTREEEKQVINSIDRIDIPNLKVVTTIEEVIQAQELAKQVLVSPDISEYIISIINSLRSDPDILSGPSTRGSIALYKCARALALLDCRDYVIPDDIKHLTQSAVGHRIRVKPEAEMDEVTPELIIKRTLDKIPVPKLGI